MPKLREKGSRKKFIGIAVGLLIIISAIGVYAFQIYVLNHPLVKYAEAEKDTIERLNNILHKYTGQENMLTDKLLNEKSETDSVIQAKLIVDRKSRLDPMVSLMLGLLSSSQLHVKQVVDPTTLETAMDANFKLQGTNLFNFKLYQNEQLTAIESPLLYKQPLGIHNSKFGDLLGDADDYLIIEFPNFVELQQHSMTPKELRELYVEYLTYIGNELRNMNFEINENVKLEGNKYTQYSLQMSEEQSKQLFKQVLTKMQDDEKIESLLYSPIIYEEDFDFIELLLSELDEMILPTGIQYNAYYKDGYVQKRDLSTTITLNDETLNFNLEIDTILTRNDEYDFKLNLKVERSNQSYFFIKYDSSGAPKEKDYEVKRRASFGFEDIFESGTFNLDINTVYKTNRTETDFTFYADIMDELFPSLTGDIIQDIHVNDTDAIRWVNLILSLDMGDLADEIYTLDVTIEENIKFGEDVAVPVMEKENILLIDELDEEQLNDLATDIEDYLNSYFHQLW